MDISHEYVINENTKHEPKVVWYKSNLWCENSLEHVTGSNYASKMTSEGSEKPSIKVIFVYLYLQDYKVIELNWITCSQ